MVAVGLGAVGASNQARAEGQSGMKEGTLCLSRALKDWEASKRGGRKMVLQAEVMACAKIWRRS